MFCNILDCDVCDVMEHIKELPDDYALQDKADSVS